jgi:hypothetical protein
LIVSSWENVDGKEDGVLTLLSGSGDRIPIASLGISTLSTDGQLVNSSSLGLSLGALTAPDHNDLLVLATNDLERRDWQVWMVPALDRPTSRLQMLDWRLDPHLLPIDVVDGNAVLTWVGGVADLDGDGRDEAVWAMSKVDYEHCALVVIGAAPGTETLRVRTTIDLDEPCGRSDLALGDADGDDRIDIVLLTGGPGRPARKLLVLWNDGEGRFSSSSSAVINPTSDSPEAFTFLPSGLRRTVSFAYVTQSAIAIVEAAPARQFAAPRVLAPVVRGSGITAADVNGDGAADLVVAASGNLLLMKAELRTP